MNGEHVGVDAERDAERDDRAQRVACRLVPIAPVNVIAFAIMPQQGRRSKRAIASPCPSSELKAQIARLPEQPGVYLFSNPAGETIYVGKARALRDRVRSYLGARGSSPKTDALLEEAAAPRGRS